MSQLYPIPLLNELHNYFPDILYNHERFRNVQDLLQYIREVANVNPYMRGRSMYRGISQSNPNTPIIVPLTVPASTISSNMSSLINSVLSELINPNELNEEFLQRVVVRPTAEQIADNTSVYISNRTEEGVCIICQETIEQNQELRKITACGHYFHKTCIDTWFTGYIQCPTCRHDIRDIEIG